MDLGPSQCVIAVDDHDTALPSYRDVFGPEFRGDAGRVRAAAGAEVLREPLDQPYGVRDRTFRDPAGDMIRSNQPRTR
ncbi:hypothetical protein ACIQV3_00530 [Streptomyces sp. NPDC099050]|uniref:hypothetical protein n=1 Tax=Streptomyces sp. NPDC099050 TaxID=3366100 RepID=UPI003826475F